MGSPKTQKAFSKWLVRSVTNLCRSPSLVLSVACKDRDLTFRCGSFLGFRCSVGSFELEWLGRGETSLASSRDFVANDSSWSCAVLNPTALSYALAIALANPVAGNSLASADVGELSTAFRCSGSSSGFPCCDLGARWDLRRGRFIGFRTSSAAFELRCSRLEIKISSWSFDTVCDDASKLAVCLK